VDYHVHRRQTVTATAARMNDVVEPLGVKLTRPFYL